MSKKIILKNFSDILLNSEEKEAKATCPLCLKKIEDTAFMKIQGSIILNGIASPNPLVFTCPEQAFNYAQGFFAHSTCWIELLRKFGVPLYDLEKVYATILKNAKRRT